jgi:hypothetical protein
MSELSFLDEGSPSNDTALPVEIAPQPAETPAVEVAAEPVAADPVVAPAAVETPVKPEPGYVPLTALMDERDKRKTAEDRIAKFEREQSQRNAPAAPDPYLDPEGAQAHTAARFQQEIVNTKLDLSETAARRHYGADKVETAKTWALGRFAEDPSFQQKLLAQPDPYEFAIQQHERETIASSVTADDFTQFQAWKAAQAQLAPATTASAATPSADPPRSIASLGHAGGGAKHVAIDEASGFNGLFS